MAFKRFSLMLIARLSLIGILMTLVVWLIYKPGLHALTILAAVTLILAAYELWHFVNRTNDEVSRFLDAARYADYSQHFNFPDLGSGFGVLGETLTDILEQFRAARGEQETDLRRLKAIVEHVPVPLVSVHTDKSLSLLNNSARRLVGTARVNHLEDLKQFGEGFYDAVAEVVPGSRMLVKFTADGMEQQLTLAATEVTVDRDRETLISLQNIQSELNMTQAEAWQDLVRVLTHEIMNSITPVSSLARTASDLVNDVTLKLDDDSPIAEDLADIHSAVETVARRSDGLMQFVHGYRQLTRLTPPDKKNIPITVLFDSVSRLAKADWPTDSADLKTSVTPQGLEVMADRDLLEPVLLNLLRNAWQASSVSKQAEITLSGRLNRRGHVIIEIGDNGPGVPVDIARKIFVPFFTTKEDGSGVGLALTRQVMIAHGGFVTLDDSEDGGAKFSLIF
jgi:two-component system nitrogen regulation sensor histidine kinase NtrY